MDKKIYSIPEAREILGGIGHTMIYELVNEGHLTKVKMGRRSFITADSINSFLTSLAVTS
jgi:hypothetical protein